MHLYHATRSDESAIREPGKAGMPHLVHERLFDLAPDGIIVVSADGLIRQANPRALELFGYSANELLGRSVEALMPERFREPHLAHRRDFNAGPRTRLMSTELNLLGLRKDGTEFPVDIMLKPIASPEGSATICFVRDMTAQRAFMETVRMQDLHLRSIVESVSGYAIYRLDPAGNVMTWNPGAERIKGYTAEEIVGKHFSIFFTQEDRERGRPAELMRTAIQDGRVEQEGWRIRKDGSQIWAYVSITTICDSNGEVVGFAAITRDLSDRKRAEEALMMEFSTALLVNLDVNKWGEAISESIRGMIPHHITTIAVPDSTTGRLVVHFLRYDEKGISRGRVSVPLVGSPDGEAFRAREPVVLGRIEESQFSHEGVRHLTDVGMQSGCWVPLIHRGELIGVLGVASSNESAFGQREAEMLAKLAGQAAVAVVNAKVFQEATELRDRLLEEKRYLEAEIILENHFEEIVGESTDLRQVLKDIETVAPTDATVLIEGETGTGKELLARAIHRLSSRREHMFIRLNCAAIPATLLESELFGHEKGAFTGAISRKLGRLELANEGTLFLDEVGEMPLDLQPKLLRALQEREFERLGGTRPIQVDVRVIAATNRDLAKMVAEKQFRADLYYRLKVFPILSPPLRHRASDIPLLVRHFVATHSQRMGKHIESIPQETMDALVRWNWPGNIRELGNLMERSVILTRCRELYVPLSELQSLDSHNGDASPDPDSEERERIERVLREARGRVAGSDGAAARLGIKRTTLNSRLKKLGISPGKFKR